MFRFETLYKSVPFDKEMGVISVTSSNTAFGVELAAREHSNLTLDESLATDKGMATSMGLWKRLLRGSIATNGENFNFAFGHVNWSTLAGTDWTCKATLIFFRRAPKNKHKIAQCG